MAVIKLTQKKSRIGASKIQCANLDALGLRKTNMSVEHNVNPQIMGMVAKVKHLIVVEEVK